MRIILCTGIADPAIAAYTCVQVEEVCLRSYPLNAPEHEAILIEQINLPADFLQTGHRFSCLRHILHTVGSLHEACLHGHRCCCHQHRQKQQKRRDVFAQSLHSAPSVLTGTALFSVTLVTNHSKCLTVFITILLHLFEYYTFSICMSIEGLVWYDVGKQRGRCFCGFVCRAHQRNG